MSHLTERQMYQLSFDALRQELGKRHLSTRGDIDVLRTRLARSWKKHHQQPYKYVAIIDFEATCQARPPVPPDAYIREIIEFPIVLIDVVQRKIIDTFHSYCQPVLEPTLSDYCTQLTGITQEQVNNAPTFQKVFTDVQTWLNKRNLISDSNDKCLFITDGPSDFQKYLHMQCQISHIEYPRWACRWFDVKKAFAEFYSVMPGRIQNMLEHLHLPFHGNLHSGLDDAKNIGRIVIELINDGCLLAPNEFYVPSADTFRYRPRSTTSEKIPSLLDLPFPRLDIT